MQALALILFLFEPYLAATLVLRIGATLLDRDAATSVAVIVRVLLALASVAAAIGLHGRRPYARGLALWVLSGSAAFAVVQYLTRVLPTSLAPDILAAATILIVAHHTAWIAFLLLRRRRGAGARH